ncbi:Bug family tripartite tricarboxylate transporter substrate binding protein [Roseomonas haemaphysalidis]|uniref:Tripartite tricarboxylate transporter substrate binding protein n=1 Tax=Roseomonas haemaphysalidis TaxID=2768162 RepID=A0ABS3KLW5_9PROT|nr:tripartite tricarboxylate transporter substrate binding protein [Roseomonas haemaphysalidis]MBO1078464.1 tripartite tricarboxylate transporter substrate binding protein [Roseomonas haemaphysalidis]
MTSNRLTGSRRGFLAAAGTLLARPALAGPGFPDRPLRIVVPFAPGGVSDILTRALAEAMTPVLGQSMVVENRSGAGGNVGAEYVAHGSPDGYTLLCASPATMGIAKPLYGKLSYDPDTELLPVGLMGAQANVLLTSSKALATPSLDGLLAAARARPGALNFGSGGSGSLAHLTGELFAKDAGVQLTHVPYRGSPPAIADLLSGQIQLIFDAVVTALPLSQAGALHILGTATAARQDSLPDVPALPELGFPSLDVPNWFGLFAPAGTPAPVLAKLQQAMAQVTGTAQWRDQLRARHSMPLALTSGPELDAFLAKERARWAAAVRTSGAQAA